MSGHEWGICSNSTTTISEYLGEAEMLVSDKLAPAAVSAPLIDRHATANWVNGA